MLIEFKDCATLLIIFSLVLGYFNLVLFGECFEDEGCKKTSKCESVAHMWCVAQAWHIAQYVCTELTLGTAQCLSSGGGGG